MKVYAFALFAAALAFSWYAGPIDVVSFGVSPDLDTTATTHGIIDDPNPMGIIDDPNPMGPGIIDDANPMNKQSIIDDSNPM